MARKPVQPKQVEDLKHGEAKRRNIPTAEYQSVQDKAQQAPKALRYPRNTDLDPQLVWRGKDEQDAEDLVVDAPPIYIQEKVHPKALIDDLLRQTRESQHEAGQTTADLFADFNGIPKGIDKTEFYQHDQNWTNRMILGDSLQVMASLAEREGLRGKVQCIYLDPPYGIKFNSNFQWSTTTTQVKEGSATHITREPEQVKAFRDTWRSGIHSYLTYLRDRLTIARDLLAESGSIFVQIGDENLHRVKSVLDEVFGVSNAGPTIDFKTTAGLASDFLAGATDHLIWYFKSRESAKFRRVFNKKIPGEEGATQFNLIQSPDATVVRRFEEGQDEALLSEGWHRLAHDNLTSTGFATTTNYSLAFNGRNFQLPAANIRWKTPPEGMTRLQKATRVMLVGSTPRYRRLLDDFPIFPIVDLWTDTGISGFSDKKFFVVQTNPKVIERCVQMVTDPGDLVLDPTCGAGTTATVAEQWGRRWITIDTSRVALALARARIMGARYPFYLLSDSRAGQIREAEVSCTAPSTQATYSNIRHGFVYERVPHITLKSIANNAEIDVIWENWQQTLEPLREQLNGELRKSWREWEIPREAESGWSAAAKKLHTDWWQARFARQKEIDASVAAKAEYEYLYDKPYVDNRTVRVAGPFTVESLSPHRMLGVDENDELIDPLKVCPGGERVGAGFEQMILENLKVAGVQQAHKEDRIRFTALSGWPGGYICAEGWYQEGETEKRAGIFIGSEFGTVSRPDLVEAAREAGDAGFDVLIACAFNYEAHANEFHKLGRIPVLKARMNADLHMAADLKATGKGNLFVVFGEPDIEILDAGRQQVRVKVHGVDIFDPSTGEVRSDDTDKIACWFVDTDYNGESFFVRQAYFLGQNDPYKALKTTLKSEIDEEAWASLHSDTSRPFPRPKSGRIAVKVINHLGDEVMKVFRL